MTDSDTPVSTSEAIAIQNAMRAKVLLADDHPPVKRIAGIDVGYDPERNLARAALVTMDIDTLTPIASVVEYDSVRFPYVPGLLSFREAPVLMKALARLGTQRPDMLFVDGQGVAHPRRLGIAAHIGVLSGLPTIGIAKKKLCGRYEEPAIEQGSRTMLFDGRERIGTVLRSRTNVKPLFVSPGHRVSQDTAVLLVMRCLRGYRLPEPTRLADKLSKFSASPSLFD
ncbi:deoxyribonuclease V [Novosphingopyxis sp.]|uniref:deoxyribonuclease V n=1 Tax=Novosphingopyxis sp. TaxID=2709690 RepID=UPI003B58BEC1